MNILSLLCAVWLKILLENLFTLLHHVNQEVDPIIQPTCHACSYNLFVVSDSINIQWDFDSLQPGFYTWEKFHTYMVWMFKNLQSIWYSSREVYEVHLENFPLIQHNCKPSRSTVSIFVPRTSGLFLDSCLWSSRSMMYFITCVSSKF